MTTELIILAIVVLKALAFDFTKGFHDTANAMASSIEVAKTVGKGLVDLNTAGGGASLKMIVFTGLVGAILWIAKDFLYAYTGFNFLGIAG